MDISELNQDKVQEWHTPRKTLIRRWMTDNYYVITSVALGMFICLGVFFGSTAIKITCLAGVGLAFFNAGMNYQTKQHYLPPLRIEDHLRATFENSFTELEEAENGMNILQFSRKLTDDLIMEDLINMSNAKEVKENLLVVLSRKEYSLEDLYFALTPYLVS